MKILILCLLFIFNFFNIKAEERLDSIFKNKPESLNKFDFKFPEYKLDFISNGIKLYLIPDERQAITNLRLIIGGGSSQDANLQGLAEISANMLLKGTKSFNAEILAEKIDFYGASIYANSSDDYIAINVTTLTKYLNEVLDLLNQVLFETKLDKLELEKLKRQYKASLISEKSDPNALASKLTKRALYGNNHPYANFPTEQSIDKITIKDIENFYKKYFVANNMSLAIFGNYNDKNLNDIYNIFKKFEKNDDFSLIELPNPEKLGKGVYFIEREGAVQSSIRIVAEGLNYSDKNYELLNFSSNIIGSGFIGRLFKILREKHSYTYSPSASISARKSFNYFSANADVKADVTDSALSVMKEIILDLATNEITQEELDAVRKFRIGGYLMSFENSDFTATLLQNGEFKGVRAKNFETYTNRIENYTKSDILKNANSFLNENNLYIIVVGPKSVKSKLEVFGNIFEFDKSINSIDDFEPVKIKAKDLINNYLKSIGGNKIFKDINILTAKGELSVIAQGQELSGNFNQFSKSPNKSYSMQDFGGNKQEKWVSGDKSWIKVSEITQEEKTTIFDKLEIMPFYIANFLELKAEYEIIGKRNGEIYLKIKDENEERVYKFNETTFILNSYTSTQDTQLGKIVVENIYSDYKQFGKYQLPTKIENKSSLFSSKMTLDYEINPKIEDSIFEVQK
jgi:predicted Zn-dependent peptidase